MSVDLFVCLFCDFLVDIFMQSSVLVLFDLFWFYLKVSV